VNTQMVQNIGGQSLLALTQTTAEVRAWGTLRIDALPAVPFWRWWRHNNSRNRRHW